MVGCASAPSAPSIATNDPVDALLAKSATAVTEALRDLSEGQGNSRVVSSKAAPAPRSAVPAQLAEAPRESIAARRAIIAVDGLQQPSTLPQPDVNLTPEVVSAGVVASGGLLSAPPAGLERLMTVQWTGELEALLGRIATETGWTLGPSKGFRAAPVIISVNAASRSAFDLLRDIGAIAGASAEIRVSAATRSIYVQYPQR
jgi:hypothetical protein